MGTTSWIAWYDAGRRCGLTYEPKANAALDAMIDLTGAGYWFAYEGAVIICEKPSELNLDAEGALHNENGPSMLFADGYALWHFHGVTVPKNVILEPDKITAKDALKEQNSEIRRVMCERMGWDNFVRDAKLKLIHQCADPGNGTNIISLYETPEKIEGESVRLFLCTNGTPKPNGEIPRYGITVPKEVSLADEAAAWISSMPLEMYKQIQRRT